MPLNYEPDGFDGIDAANGYYFARDNGYYSGPEQIDFYEDIETKPGEIWEVRITLSLSSQPTDGPIILEVFDVNGDYLIQKTLETYDGTYMELQFTVPAYEVNADFSAPADNDAQGDIGFQVGGSDGGNYWATVEQIRLRSPLNRSDETQGDGTTDSFSSGRL